MASSFIFIYFEGSYALTSFNLFPNPTRSRSFLGYNDILTHYVVCRTENMSRYKR